MGSAAGELGGGGGTSAGGAGEGGTGRLRLVEPHTRELREGVMKGRGVVCGGWGGGGGGGL